MGTPRHLLDCWPQALKKLRAAGHIVLFLDFDGTLVRLRRRPEDVRLAASRRRLLGRLARRSRVSIYFISGRALAELRALVQVPGAHYLGLHGWEQRHGASAQLPGNRRMARARRFVKSGIQNLPGVWLQDKRACLAVHYRTASAADAQRAHTVVLNTLERLGPEFRLLSGKKIWELLPREIGTKGDAALGILRRRGGRPAVFYFGDDTTDETAFAALQTAFTVRVGKFHKTKARYFLKGPGEVSDFLSKLDGVLAADPGSGRMRPEASRRK